MTAPALTVSVVNSTNSQTTTGTGSVLAPSTAYLIVVRIVCAADAGEIPQFVLTYSGSSGSLTTEDGDSINVGASGTVVYKDGTSGSVSYDHILRTNDSTSAIYIWSIKATTGNGANPSVGTTWTKNGTGTSFKSEISAWTSSGTIPTRANRKLTTYSQNGTGTGTGNYTISRDGSSNPPTTPALVVGVANAASGTSTAQTVDFDKDGTTTQNNTTIRQATNQQNWFFDGTFDTSDAHLINGTDFTVNFAANPGAQKCIGAVVYKMETPATTGTASLVGGGTLSASGTRTTFGTSALAGGGTLTALGKRTAFGTLLISGGGTLHLDRQGVTTINGTATLIGGGTLAAAGARQITGTATIVGGGTISLVGVRKTTGTATLIGGGTFTTQQLTSTTTYSAGGSWSAGSQVQVGGRSWTGTATLSGGGTFAASGHKIASGQGNMTFVGGGSLHMTGHKTVTGTCTLSGGGTLRALSTVYNPGTPTSITFARNSTLTTNRISHIGLQVGRRPAPSTVVPEPDSFSYGAQTAWWSKTINGHTELYTGDGLPGGTEEQITDHDDWDSWFISVAGSTTLFGRTPSGTLDKTLVGTVDAGGIDASSTTLNVTAGHSGWSALTLPFCTVIGTEMLRVTSRGTGNNWTVVRGVAGTTAASHSANASLLGGYNAFTTWTQATDQTGLTQVLGFPKQVDATWINYGHPVISPDGSSAVFFAQTATAWALVQVRTSDWAIMRLPYLSAKPNVCIDPSFSPDSTKIVFTEYISGIFAVSVVSGLIGAATAAGYKVLWRQVPIGVVATSNVTVSSAPATIDGSAYGTCLLVGQTDPTQNGVYTYSSTGSPLTRNTGFDTGAEIVGGSCHIAGGDTLAGSYWECDLTAAPTLGVTPITYTRRARGVVGGPNDPVFNDTGTAICFENVAVSAVSSPPVGEWDVCTIPYDATNVLGGPRAVLRANGNVNSRPVFLASPDEGIMFEELDVSPLVRGFQLMAMSLDGSLVTRIGDGEIPYVQI